MKNIFKLLFTFSIMGMLFVTCEEKEVGFEAIMNAPDPAATYYVQFINASQTKETGVTESGNLVEVELPVAVSLMGMPQNQDITVDLTLDPASTFTSNMFTLSSNKITIPAGKTSGSVNFKTIASKMPVGQTLKFILNLSAGEHNSPSTTGIKLTYNIKRIEFCPLVNGAADLVGSWAGTDAYYPSAVTTALKGADLEVSGMNSGFMVDWWGEAITAGGSFTMKVKGNGTLEIPRQYIFTTVYKGAPYDYEILGSGKWENCGTKPKLIITYDIYYVGDADGLAKQYASYLDNIPYLTAELTLK